MKKKKKKDGTQYINIVDISRETNERNGVETVAHNDGKLSIIIYIRRTRS